MGAADLIAMAMSFSLLAGWRLYAAVLVAGLAIRFDILPLPDQLAGLSVLGNPLVMGIAALGAIAEFPADKVAWIDSAWDAIHSPVRPAGGALLALAIVDPAEPVWQVATLLLGGDSALLAHGAKASARAAVNLSPEPVSNVVVSSAEDVATTGALLLALANPWIALALVALPLLAAVGLVIAMRRFVRNLGSIFTPAPPADRPPPPG